MPAEPGDDAPDVDEPADDEHPPIDYMFVNEPASTPKPPPPRRRSEPTPAEFVQAVQAARSAKPRRFRDP